MSDCELGQQQVRHNTSLMEVRSDGNIQHVLLLCSLVTVEVAGDQHVSNMYVDTSS